MGFNLQDSSGSQDSDGSLLVDDIIENCEVNVKSAKQETVGIDMGSYAVMSQATSQVAAVGGMSAKLSHQANAGINSVLAANAAKRCTKCKGAISRCKEECDSTSKCESIKIDKSSKPCVKSAKETGYGKCLKDTTTNNYDSICEGNCKTAISECDGELKKLQGTCESFSTPCGQACLQAGLSTLTAAASLVAAGQLGRCEGDECKNLPDPDPDPEPKDPKPDIPKNSNAPSPSGVVYGRVYGEGDSENNWASKNNPVQLGSALAGGETKTNKGKTTPKDSSQPRHYYERDGSSGIAGDNSNPESSKNSAGKRYSGNQASLAGNQASSAGNLNRSKKKKSYRKDEDEDEDEEGINWDQEGFRSGGSATGYSRSGSHSGRSSFGGFKRDNQDKDSKRELSGKSDSQANGKSDQDFKDTIFVRASRLIYKFCDNNKC